MSLSTIEITGAGNVSVSFFCDVVKLMGKHFGKGLVIPIERMDLIRQAASVLEIIATEAKEAK